MSDIRKEAKGLREQAEALLARANLLDPEHPQFIVSPPFETADRIVCADGAGQ